MVSALWDMMSDSLEWIGQWQNGTEIAHRMEVEALAVWLELTEEEQKDYALTKRKAIDTIQPMRFISLDKFHKLVLHPEETFPCVYIS